VVHSDGCVTIFAADRKGDLIIVGLMRLRHSSPEEVLPPSLSRPYGTTRKRDRHDKMGLSMPNSATAAGSGRKSKVRHGPGP
jgi:hypothetical protein